MFRWAVCQLDILGKCRNRVMLRNALATLPPTLDQTYDRILSAISKEDSEYALRILRWLTFSARPLSIDEVAEVVAIDAKRDPAFDRDEVLEDPLEVLNICSSLVTMAVDNKYRNRESPRQIVTLAHYSVKEYLVSDRIWTGKAAKYGMRGDVCHDAIAAGSLGYLLQFQQPQLKPDFLRSFNLARYSAEFWSSHAQKRGNLTKETTQIAVRLCSRESFAYINWIRLWNPDKPWDTPDFWKGPKKIPNPLYFAALLNLRDMVKVLLDKDADVNAQGGDYGNALQAASYRGHEAVVTMLLDKDADVNAQGGHYGNALQAASYRGHEAMVKMLLDKDADVNAQGGLYGNALQAASLGGHEAVVKMLLDKDADVNAQGWRLRQRTPGGFIGRPRGGGEDAARQGCRRQRAGWTLQQRTPGGFIQRPRGDGEDAARQGRRRQRAGWRLRQRTPGGFIRRS
ncbi:hypothetical protein BCR34DRAFT_231296 [Clohesyomyces aquaticus]|uniref:GPI inositol-deacylase winged helix domain-containing protein n=1 Tax=Clohesyomyces aquaticus TaxID=1231657 RepID=A0A1Y1ZVW5_9PLEO|nr:hypothetical protein BCR34DRAFT_231296 [Clohesyomyces aquaticus]